MRRFVAFTLMTALAGFGGAQATASVDARADEAVTIFENYCVVNGGTRDEALNRIDKSAIAKPVPENVLSNLQFGRKGGMGWLIATPHDGQLILAYDPIGVCEVAVVSADADSMRRAFQALIGRAKTQLNVQIVEGQQQVSNPLGVKVVATPYSFPFLGKITTLTLTTAEKRMPVGFQYTMTSTFNKK